MASITENNNNFYNVPEHSLIRWGVDKIDQTYRDQQKYGTLTRSIIVVVMPLFALLDTMAAAGKTVFHFVTLSPDQAHQHWTTCKRFIELFFRALGAIPFALCDPKDIYLPLPELKRDSVERPATPPQEHEPRPPRPPVIRKEAPPLPDRVNPSEETSEETLASLLLPPPLLDFDNGEVMLPKMTKKRFLSLVRELYLNLPHNKKSFEIYFGKEISDAHAEEYLQMNVKFLDLYRDFDIHNELDNQALYISSYGNGVQATYPSLKEALCRATGSEVNDEAFISLIENLIDEAEENATLSAEQKSRFENASTKLLEYIRELKSFFCKISKTLEKQIDLPDYERSSIKENIEKRLDLLERLKLEAKDFEYFQQVPHYNEIFLRQVSLNFQIIKTEATCQQDVTRLRSELTETSLDNAKEKWQDLHDKIEAFR